MKMLIEGRVANFKDAVVYLPAKDGKKSSCRVKVNVATTKKQKDANGKDTQYFETEIFTIYGYDKVADNFLRNYQPKDQMVCWATFNGVNLYKAKDGGELKFGGIDCWLEQIIVFPSSNNSQASNKNSKAIDEDDPFADNDSFKPVDDDDEDDPFADDDY